VYHNATLRLGTRTIALDFPQAEQNSLDSLRFDDASTLKEIPHGKGRIFWAAYPVELSEDLQSTADLYSYVASGLNISPMFTSRTPVPPGILVFPTVFEDSILYVLVSDSADNAAIQVRDNATGADLTMTLPAEHAAIAVISKRDKKIVARYGFAP
jgi:hypothetical protein